MLTRVNINENLVLCRHTSQIYCYVYLSYDVAVFQWITSCNKKCYDHMCINIFAGTHNVIDDARNNNINIH